MCPNKSLMAELHRPYVRDLAATLIQQMLGRKVALCIVIHCHIGREGLFWQAAERGDDRKAAPIDLAQLFEQSGMIYSSHNEPINIFFQSLVAGGKKILIRHKKAQP